MANGQRGLRFIASKSTSITYALYRFFIPTRICSKDYHTPQRYHNRPDRLDYRRNLRRRSTRAEKKLCSRLRNKQIGIRFRRQHSLGTFIADFYCAAVRLVIEIDGASHLGQKKQKYDAHRTRSLNTYGFTVVRYTNEQVCDNIDGVITDIHRIVEELSYRSTTHNPLL